MKAMITLRKDTPAKYGGNLGTLPKKTRLKFLMYCSGTIGDAFFNLVSAVHMSIEGLESKLCVNKGEIVQLTLSDIEEELKEE